MTFVELQTRTLERLGEASAAPVFYTLAMVKNALNHAQQLFAFLTLCLEDTQTFALTQGQVWYTSDPGGRIVILRARQTGGVKVIASRLADLDSLNPDWQQETQGPPARYAQTGARLFAVHPPPSAGQSIVLTLAVCPAIMTLDADVPQIPEEYHPCLMDCAVPLLRSAEGGDQFEKELPRFDAFLNAAAKLGNYVRARNLEQRYDVLPVELDKVDRSKLVEAMKMPKPKGVRIPQAEEQQ